MQKPWLPCAKLLVNSPFLIPLLVEWVVASALMAPTVMLRPKVFYRHPTFGLICWLGLFAVGVIAASSAVLLAFLSVFETWLTLEQPAGQIDWFQAISVAFAPWVLLAVGGISIAMVNQRLTSLFSSDNRVDLSILGGKSVAQVGGYRVIELPLPFAHISSSSRDSLIIQTSGAVSLLSTRELEACWQHEVVHLKFGHGKVLSVVNLVHTLSKRLVATQALKREVTLLLELIADKAVSDRAAARSALVKLGGTEPSREIMLRLRYLAE